jgi:hypothetical protein
MAYAITVCTPAGAQNKRAVGTFQQYLKERKKKPKNENVDKVNLILKHS